MSEMGFVLKSFATAVALIMILQIDVGGQKLEQRADTWLHSAKIAKFMQAVADGAIHLTHTGIAAAQHLLSEDPNASATGSRAPAPQEQRASK